MILRAISSARDYNAHIEAISQYVPLSVAHERIRGRRYEVHEKVIEKLALKREPIMPDEAHELWSCNANGDLTPLFGVSLRPVAPQRPYEERSESCLGF
jgi:hypothetical protein